MLVVVVLVVVVVVVEVVEVLVVDDMYLLVDLGRELVVYRNYILWMVANIHFVFGR